MSETVILAVCFQLKQLKKQPEKNSGLNRTRTHDLANTHCEDHSFTHVYPQFTCMIFIYSYSYIITIIGFMKNSQLTIYPCGLIVQWIDHCTGIRKVMGSSPVQT